MYQVLLTLITILFISPLFAQVTDESTPTEKLPDTEFYEIEIEEAPKKNEYKDQIYTIVEEMPYFTSCDTADGYRAKKACGDQNLLEFIYSNLQYPSLAKENGIEGTVVISFVINTKGKVENIQVLRDAGGGTGAETVRIIQLMNDLPKEKGWTPGRHKGYVTNVKWNLPIRFSLTKTEKREAKKHMKHVQKHQK